MSEVAIRVENLGKIYRLGEIGTGTISHDLNRWMARIRGKEDPFTKIGENNDRTKRGESDYVWALKDVSFEVRKGTVLGIIGNNGAGKSTLLKLLSKVTKPSSGRMKINGRIASLLEVGTGFHPEMTGRENVFLNGAILGMTKKEIKSKFDAIVDFAGVERYIDTPVKRYSSGMYVRLAFAVAAFLEPEILIVDEVLAVGDAEFQKKCLGRMKEVSINDGRTVLFVSHNMGSVASLCDEAIMMHQGTIREHGNTASIIQKYLQYNTETQEIQDKRLEYVKFYQEQEKLIIELKYNLPDPVDIPSLGFEISDAYSNVVTGSNLMVDGHKPVPGKTYQNGVITVILTEPRLMNGDYSLSIWLGNSVANFIKLPDCARVKIINMCENQRYAGVAAPTCQWIY